MKKAIILFVAVALAVAGSPLHSCPQGDMDANCNYKKQEDWSWIMFVLTWSGTFCNDNCCKIPRNVDSIVDGFTIHGFWPNYDGDSYPACCDSPYDEDEVHKLIDSDFDLRVELDTYWPSLKKCKFVEYEWDKHGTCASTVYNGTDGPLDYWRATLNLAQRWDLLGALEDRGITPGSTKYDVDEFRAAIESKVGARVSLQCDSHQLSEVRICIERPNEYNKLNPEVMDCPDYEHSTCSKYIILPEVPSMEIGDCE